MFERLEGRQLLAATAGTLVSEDFAAGAANFSVIDGTWGVVDGTYRATSGGTASTAHLNTRAVHSTDISGDFSLTADASVTNTSSAWNDFAVIFGYQDSNNYYFFSSNESNDAATSGIFRVSNGVSTELADASTPIVGGTTYQVRVEKMGDRVNAYRNGTLVATAAGANGITGRVGVGSKGDQVTFDNLAVSAPVAAPATPSAPSDVAATVDSDTSINLTWVDNSVNESGFAVERSTDTLAWNEIGRVGAGTTAYAATGLQPSTNYFFRVRAFNDAGNSPYSNVAGVKTTALRVINEDFAGGAGGFGVVDGTWSVANGAYQVATASTTDSVHLNNRSLHTTAIDGDFTLDAQASVVNTAVAWNDFAVIFGYRDANNYYFFSSNESNDGATSGLFKVVNGVSTELADIPTAITAGTTYTLRVERSGGQIRAYRDGALVASATDSTFTTGRVGFGTKNDRATFDNLVVSGTAATGPSPVPATPPAAPSALSAAASSATQINLTWVDASADETGFKIERSSNGGTTWAQVGTVGAGVTNYAANGLTSGTSYQFRVRAYNAVGDSPYSNVASAATQAAPPTAPSGLTASAASTTQINLGWADNSTDETGFKIERSPDGTNFAQVATVGANVRTYAATGLSASTTYHFRVRAYNAAGDSAYTTSASATTQASPTTPTTLVAPPRAAVDAAIAAPLIRYNRTIAGGAHTNGAWNGGASVTLALASYAGDTRADARLLEQMRYTITGGNDISANGGYPAQHERHVTGMYTLAKLTPRVWNQLTAAERNKIDLLMKASLVSSAFTTSDNNPYIRAGQQQRALDGDTNLGRDWNPNYREGMVGGALAGAAYFGPAQAESVLSSYDHAAFVAELQAAGLTNIRQTFNWKAANPSSIAPDASTIQNAVRAPYRYYGLPLTDVMGIYGRLLTNTYGGTVSPGLNNGAGINGAGRIVSGADTLPNRGAVGMLMEFDSSDGNGPRSSAHYAYDGFRPHQTNVLTLVASGLWQNASATARQAATRLDIGNTDLWYKIDRGYIGYAKGASQGTFSTANNAADFGFAYNRPVWEQVLRPYLAGANSPSSPTTPTPIPTGPAAPSDLAATASGSSRIDLTWTDNSSDESGFKIERSTNGSTWTQVGTAGANVRTYSATGLNASTTYNFRVRAYNSAGDSPYTPAASAATAAAPAPSPTGETLGGYAKPSASNTGLKNPSALVARSGGLTTTADGQVIENIDFTSGGITVLHNNVIIRNCRIRGTISAGGEGAIRSGVRVEDCELLGGGLGGGISLYRNYVHGLRNGDFWRNPSNCTWESNYFEDIEATSTTPHIDMIQWYWSNQAQRISQANLVVRGNYWNVRTDYAYANQFNAILFNDMGMTHITWEYNWMKSGGYVIRNHSNSTTNQFNNNIWEGWGWGPMLTGGGYSNIGFNGNQVWRNGTLQAFQKPGGTNGDLFTNV